MSDKEDAATPDPALTIVRALGDCESHASSWRKALVITEAAAEVSEPDLDDKSYWRHELAAFDRTFAVLAQVPREALRSAGHGGGKAKLMDRLLNALWVASLLASSIAIMLSQVGAERAARANLEAQQVFGATMKATLAVVRERSDGPKESCP